MRLSHASHSLFRLQCNETARCSIPFRLGDRRIVSNENRNLLLYKKNKKEQVSINNNLWFTSWQLVIAALLFARELLAYVHALMQYPHDFYKLTRHSIEH